MHEALGLIPSTVKREIKDAVVVCSFLLGLLSNYYTKSRNIKLNKQEAVETSNRHTLVGGEASCLGVKHRLLLYLLINCTCNMKLWFLSHTCGRN